MRHKEFRDFFTNSLSDVCHDVDIESHLQLWQGETFALNSTTTDNDARLDSQANGILDSRFNKAHFDAKIFNPLAKICPQSSSEAYKYHESIKKRTNMNMMLRKQNFVILSRRHWWSWPISVESTETTDTEALYAIRGHLR